MLGPHLQVRSTLRDAMPTEEGVLAWLVDRARESVKAGERAPWCVVVRDQAIDALPLVEAARTGMPPAWVLAGLTASDTAVGGKARAVGIVGPVQRHGPGRPKEPAALVFLEWSDLRWWLWSAPIEGGLLDETRAEVRAATRGDALPDGLGRWWSAARRQGLRMNLRALAPDPTGGVDQ